VGGFGGRYRLAHDSAQVGGRLQLQELVKFYDCWFHFFDCWHYIDTLSDMYVFHALMASIYSIANPSTLVNRVQHIYFLQNMAQLETFLS
jgi:hypothetical protein